MTILDIPVKTLDGEDSSLGATAPGSTLLVVNVASQCGLTPQYTALEALYEKHEKDGLVIIGVPPDRVKILREAFNKTMEDKEFLAELEKRKFDLDPSPGEELEKIVKDVMNILNYGEEESVSPKIKKRSRNGLNAY